MSIPQFHPASPVPVPPYIAGRWYPTGIGATNAGLAVATAVVRLYAFTIRAPITVSTLLTRVSVVGLGSFQLAIYANNTATGRPTGAVLARTGDMSSTVATAVTGDITGADVTLYPGIYWAATNVDATSATTTFQTLNSNNSESTTLFGAATPTTATGSTTTSLVTLTTPMAYNTWDTMTGATFTEVAGGNTGAAFIWLLAA
jgi:hypothetical protein